MQRIRRALIRLLRDPAQLASIRDELDDIDYARLQERMSAWMSAWMSGDDINMRFKDLEVELEKHVNGADPGSRLRGVRLAGYHKDPRYIRLLNMTGFDDEAHIR